MWQPVIVAYFPLMEVQTSVTVKGKKKKRKGAERDISFYMQINKCSFLDIQAWIRAYFKLSSKHFILLYSACSFKFLCLVVSMIRYHSKKPLIWFCYCWLVKQLKLKVQIQ